MFDWGVRRVPVLAAAAIVAVLGVVAAPALSLKPYRPEPVDFSIAGGGVLGTPDGGTGVVSEPLRTPKRFNLVGLTWRADRSPEPALAIRTRAEGGRWTRWAPVSTHAEDGHVVAHRSASSPISATGFQRQMVRSPGSSV